VPHFAASKISRQKGSLHICSESLFLSLFLLQDEIFTVKIVFSGEVNFRMSGRVNRHNAITGEQQSVCSERLQ
jgi:hypothetical protein